MEDEVWLLLVAQTTLVGDRGVSVVVLGSGHVWYLRRCMRTGQARMVLSQVPSQFSSISVIYILLGGKRKVSSSVQASSSSCAWYLYLA